MKDKLKKLTFALLLLAMTSTAAFAKVLTGNCGDGVTYSYDSDTEIITIEGNGKMTDYDSKYSSVYNGYVTMAPWGEYSNKISKVVIGNGITHIGTCAFYGCISITAIELSETVATIGMRAFQECNKVTSLTIPKSLESFSFIAFNCQSVTSIKVDAENPYFDSREDCNAIIRKSDDRLMLGCANTVIPSSVRSISDRAFMECSSLTSLIIPEKVSYIGDFAFSGCTGLTSLKVDERNPYLDSRNDCNAVINTSTNELIVGTQNTIIPNTVTRIGNYAFYGCEFSTFVVPEGVTSIGDSAFDSCRNLVSIDLPESLKSIENSAFSGCSSLGSIVIPNSVTSIGSSAFYYCSGLTSVTIPNSVTSIGIRAFCGCSGLTSVTIPNSVTTVADMSFSYCSALKSVTIGSSVASIGSSVFSYSSRLTELKLLPSTPPDVKASTFQDADYDRINLIVPRKNIDAYKEHEVWGKFKNIGHSMVLKVEPAKSEMLIDETLELQVERSPDIENEPIVWSCSNANVAKVNNGIVTALAEGTAEITASCDGMTAVCQITVVSRKTEEVVWGYCDNTVGGGIGNGYDQPMKYGILIPAETLSRYIGSTISSIEIGLADDVTDLVPVISIGGSENYADQPARIGKAGWNEIELDNPYTIGTDDLYVGCQYVGTYAAAMSNTLSDYASYIFENDNWNNYSRYGWGAFCVRIHIKGYDLPMDVALNAGDEIKCALGETVRLAPNVQNLSPETVTSLTLSCYIDGKLEGRHEVATNIEKGKVEPVPFAITAPTSAGIYSVRIQVESVNGKKDMNETNNTVTIPLTISGKSFARRVVMEELTGTWCGNCPRGIHAMKAMTEKYPDNFIGIAVHGGDEMAGADNYYYQISSMLNGSYPSSIANRLNKYKLNASLSEMEQAVLEMKDNAIADIKAEMMVLDADTTEVMIKTSAEFGMTVTVPFRIAYAVVENGVGPYVQENYYSGSSVDLGGLEKEGAYIYMTYNDVARGIYDGFNGVEGSLPSTIKSGVVYNYDYRLRLPRNIDHKSNIEVVAMLINQESGEIVNAYKCSYDGKTDNINEIVNTIDEGDATIYSINGVRQNAPQRGINIIKMSNGMTKKVVVR